MRRWTQPRYVTRRVEIFILFLNCNYLTILGHILLDLNSFIVYIC